MRINFQPQLIVAITVIAMWPGGRALAEYPQSIEWLDHYGAARRLSDETNRPVFLYLTTDSCIHCLRMEHGSFQDDRVAAVINHSFVPARLKLSPESSLVRDLKVTVYPTTVIIAPDGKILEYVRGYMGTDDLRERLAMAIHGDTTIAAKD